MRYSRKSWDEEATASPRPSRVGDLGADAKSTTRSESVHSRHGDCLGIRGKSGSWATFEPTTFSLGRWAEDEGAARLLALAVGTYQQVM